MELFNFCIRGTSLQSMAILWPAVNFQETTFDSSGSSAVGTITSAFATPHRGHGSKNMRGEQKIVPVSTAWKLLLQKRCLAANMTREIFFMKAITERGARWTSLWDGWLYHSEADISSLLPPPPPSSSPILMLNTQPSFVGGRERSKRRRRNSVDKITFPSQHYPHKYHWH